MGGATRGNDVMWLRAPKRVPVRESSPVGTVPADDVWAAWQRQGPVPAGWVGLRIGTADAYNPVCLAWVEAGAEVPPPSNKSLATALWWVRSDPWRFSFAPQPALVPEAGLEVCFTLRRLEGLRGVDVGTTLARHLADRTADLTTGHWAQAWVGLRSLRNLPPCAQSADGALTEAARALTETLGPTLIEVSLKRVDLCAESETDSEPVDASAHVQPAESGPAQTTRSPAMLATKDVLLLDRLRWWQLRNGLSALALDLERCWTGGGWSSNRDVARRQRGIAQNLGLLLAKLGALPSLEPNQNSRRPQTSAKLAMVQVHGAQAIEALMQARLVLGTLTAKRPPLMNQLAALEDAMALLEEHIQGRLLPWWE